MTPLLLAALSLGAAPAASAAGEESKTEAKAPKTRRFVFTYEAAYGQVPKEGKTFDFWIPVPKETDAQKISDMVIYAPGGGLTGEEPEYGNRVFHGSSGPRGGVPISLKIRFVAERREIVHEDLAKTTEGAPAPPEDLGRYLEGDKGSPIDGEIKALAARLTKGAKSDAGKARAVFDYVTQEIRRAEGSPSTGSGDVKSTISLKRGNSLDLSSTFVALARAAGVPARVIVGFEIPPNLSQGALGGYHCWAEFYLEGLGWVPADPADASEAGSRAASYFGRLDANHLQVSVGRDVTLAPPQKGAPQPILFYPYAEMDGEPLGHSSYRFTFAPPPKE